MRKITVSSISDVNKKITITNRNNIRFIGQYEEELKYKFTCDLIYNDGCKKKYASKKGKFSMFRIHFIIRCKEYILTEDEKKKSIIDKDDLINRALKISKDVFDEKYCKNHSSKQFTFFQIVKYRKIIKK
jgi:hypothetical protein